MNINNCYSDFDNDNIELTAYQLKYFNDTVTKIKNRLNINIEIINFNHDLLEGKHKNALGCCYTEDFKNYRITIDNYFINECYIAIEKPFLKIIPESLEEVICHEIAHTTIWRHGKKHKALINEYLELL